MSDTHQKISLLVRLEKSRWVEPLLGALVAIYGIFTAWAAYNAGIYGGNSNEAFFIALGDLTAANSEYAYADLKWQQDNQAITESLIQRELGAPQSVIDTIEFNYSPEALDAIQRSGDLDDEYFTALYSYPQDLVANSNTAFAAASAWDELGDRYEFLLLMLAFGLGFAAWASLMDRDSVMRYMFLVIALLALLINLGLGVDLLRQPLPEQVEAVATQSEALP